MNSPTAEEYAAIYARKSTKLENNSLISQASLAREEIKKRNLFVYDVYEDEESATKFHPMHRPGFKRLLYDAMQGRFKTLVVFRRDRLARKVEDLIEIKNFFKDYGIRIVYSNYGEYQVDENSYLSGFIENIIMSVDELEPSILSERIAIGKMQKRKKGHYFYTLPPGYKYSIDNKTGEKVIVENKEKSDVIKYIFNNFLKKVTNKSDFSLFVQELNDIYKPKKKYSEEKVTDIILKPLYGGLMTISPNTDVRKTFKAANTENINVKKFIIDEELYINCTNMEYPLTALTTKKNWFSCALRWREIIPERNTLENKEEEYLFKDIIYCKTCSDPIYLIKEPNIYRCIKGCSQIEKTFLEDFLLNKIIEDLLSKENLEKYQKEKLKKLTDDISKVEKSIDKIRCQKNLQMYKLIGTFNPNTKANYTLITDLIYEEKKKEQDIDDKKKEAIKINIALEQLSEIYRAGNIDIIINKFKKNIVISQELFKNIISKIVIKDNKKVKLSDPRGCQIHYIK